MKKLLLAMGALSITAVMVEASTSPKDITVSELIHNTGHLWTDTIGFGSDNPNFGSPDTVGVFNGTPVRFGFDYNYLERIVYLGQKPEIYSSALKLESADRTANTATFTFGSRTKTIDFNKADAMESLAGFAAAPRGWRREALTYSLGMKPDGEPETDSMFVFPIDTRVIVDYPEDEALAKVYFEAISSSFDNGPGKIGNAHSLVDQLIALNLDENHSVEPATPNRVCEPMQGFNTTMYYYPEYITDGYVTVCEMIDETYPAGGCFSESVSYRTFNRAKGRELKFNDIFDSSKYNDILAIYLDAVAKSLYNYEIGTYDDDSEELRPYTAAEVADIIAEAADDEKTPIISDNGIALCADGVIFTCEASTFTDFGEDSPINIVIPTKVLAPFMK